MMAGKYQAYSEYKNSGLETVEKIPAHWKPARFKHLARIKNGQDYKHVEVPESDESFPVIGSGGQFTHAKEYLFKGKSVLLGRKGTIDKPLYMDGAFWTVDTMFYSEVLKGTDARFLYYCALTIPFGFYSTNTALPSMTQENLAGNIFVVPEFKEQEQIANFLDHETAKIDTLIDKQQQLVRLLREKRQAVISHAVTKGLNPDAPMKDSGVEWLGEVPEGWEVLRVGILFSGSSARAESETELEYPILRVSIHHGISDKELDEEEMDRKVSRSEDRSLYKVVGENDLAYNMMRAWQGGFGAAKVNGLISPAYVVCKPKAELNSSYFELVLRSPNAVTELKRFSRGITDFRLRLYWDEFKNIKVPIPPAGEIDNILQHIGKVNSKYDQISASAQKQIDLLIERRTALISAAVTGKIDVRNWKPENKGQEL